MSSNRHSNITLTKFTYFGSNINRGHPSLSASPTGSYVTFTWCKQTWRRCQWT